MEADGNEVGEAEGSADGFGVGLPTTYVGDWVGLEDGKAVGTVVG